MLPPLTTELRARRDRLATEPLLRAIAGRLEGLLGSLAQGPVYIPDAKALLSRDGGVCPNDGSRLVFDPDRPHRHRCGRCGTVVESERHHRAWVARYQIWLSERTVHLALLGALLDRRDLSRGAAGVLVDYARRYDRYPLEDNVLGPSRPFFSTYLESVWLTQLAFAYAFVECSAPSALTTGDRDAIRAMLHASGSLVASFDEGASNRQVWNAAAMLAAGAALGDETLTAAGEAHLHRLLAAVGPDGLWHEGENYHLFALRGFLLGAEAARWLEKDLYAKSALGAMYAAPLDGLLPDLTLPARGDAPFGVSVAQPRFVELWEHGWARTADARLADALRALYDADLPEREDDGRADVAEQEENRPPARQHRDRLGWKALLWMSPHLPPASGRRDAMQMRVRRSDVVARLGRDTVVGLEIGGRGGHGHPDALHLSLFRRVPVFADFGTGSYVRPSLHWYRSTLAHNAPGVAGRGQLPGAGACDAAGTAEGVLACRVTVSGVLGAGSEASRLVVATERWVLDVVSVSVEEHREVDLPLHPLAGMGGDGDPLPPGTLAAAAGAGHESGYEAVTEPREVLATEYALPGGLRLVCVPRNGERLMTALAPGPPAPDFSDGRPLRFLVRRASGPGRWVHVVAPAGVHVRDAGAVLEIDDRGTVWRVANGPERVKVTRGGTEVLAVTARPRGADTTAAPRRRDVEAEVPLVPDEAAPFLEGRAAWWALGEAAYRRSEAGHAARGGTRAELEIAAQADVLWVRVRVWKAAVVVRGAGAPDPALDNETPDVHSDGVQAFLGREAWMGVLAVPDFEEGGVRVGAVRGTAPFPAPVSGRSRRHPDGYEVVLCLPAGRRWRRGDRLRFTVTVNEMVPGRDRRAGQLTTADAGWVWLRGDREAEGQAVEAEVV